MATPNPFGSPENRAIAPQGNSAGPERTYTDDEIYAAYMNNAKNATRTGDVLGMGRFQVMRAVNRYLKGGASG